MALPNYEKAQSKMNDKNIITVNLSLSQDQTITGTSVTKLTLNSIREQLGSKLTLQNNSVTIGAGVNHVLVSAQILINAHTTDDLRTLEIYKNSETYVRAMKRVVYNYETMGIANALVPVTEGDTISLYLTNSGSNPSTTVRGGTLYSYLTVEVID